jgi:hypothetical protein
MSEADYQVEKVVSMSDLARATSEGWQVVERIEYDAAIDFQDSYMPPAQPGFPSYPQSYTRGAIGRVVAFRVRRSGNDLVAKLTAQVGELMSKVQEAEAEAGKELSELADEKRRHELTKQHRDIATAESEKMRQRIEDVIDSNIKLASRFSRVESDLAKVRDHIGRKAFEEILPPKLHEEG